MAEGFIILIHELFLKIATVLNSLGVYKIALGLFAHTCFIFWCVYNPSVLTLKAWYLDMKTDSTYARILMHQLVENILLSFLFLVVHSILTEKV